MLKYMFVNKSDLVVYPIICTENISLLRNIKKWIKMGDVSFLLIYGLIIAIEITIIYKLRIVGW